MISSKRMIGCIALVSLALLYLNLRLLPLTHVYDIKEALGDSVMDSFKIRPANRLVHVSRFGLGHRLIRNTSAYHLAKKLGLGRMKLQWGSCSKDTNWRGKEGQDEYNIAQYLFGNDIIYIPSPDGPQREGKRVIIRNDVYGYLPGQVYKSYSLPISRETYTSNDGPFLEKLASDSEFYQKLSDKYVFMDEVNEFMQQHRFSEHTVVGIHLRFGNGEDNHFEWAGRGIDDEHTFNSNFMQLIKSLLSIMETEKPLIFLATDTPQLIDDFVKATENVGVKTVHLPQIRVAPNKGVSFKAFEGQEQKCLLGWKAMVTDMMLLAHSDLLIAARHSSFTQSLPLSFVFDRQTTEEKAFCEVATDGSDMTCFNEKKTWIFRDDDDVTKIRTVSKEKGINDKSTNHVTHKLLVSLPDIEVPKEFDDVKAFLAKERDAGASDILMHTYGEKAFYPKYRKKMPQKTSWNFVE